MSRDELRRTITRDEGTGPMKHGRHMPYTDTAGKVTIGFGRNLTDRGLSMVEADICREHDIDDAIKDLIVRYPWVDSLDPVRQGVLVNMTFNLGIARLSGFKQTLARLQLHDYEGASVQMLESLWASQVGHRALRLAEQMRRGVWV